MFSFEFRKVYGMSLLEVDYTSKSGIKHRLISLGPAALGRAVVDGRIRAVALERRQMPRWTGRAVECRIKERTFGG